MISGNPPATEAAARLRLCALAAERGASSAFCSVNSGALKGLARARCSSVLGYILLVAERKSELKTLCKLVQKKEKHNDKLRWNNLYD